MTNPILEHFTEMQQDFSDITDRITGDPIYDVQRWASASAAWRTVGAISGLLLVDPKGLSGEDRNAAFVNAENRVNDAVAYALALAEVFNIDPTGDEGLLAEAADGIGEKRSPDEVVIAGNLAADAVYGKDATFQKRAAEREKVKNEALQALPRDLLVNQALTALQANAKADGVEWLLEPKATIGALLKAAKWHDTMQRAYARRIRQGGAYLVTHQSTFEALLTKLEKAYTTTRAKAAIAYRKEPSDEMELALQMVEDASPTLADAIAEHEAANTGLLALLHKEVATQLRAAQVEAAGNDKVKHDDEVKTGDSMI